MRDSDVRLASGHQSSLFLLACLIALMTGFSWAQAPDLVVDSLRCEYKENPLGIDSTVPRLSWKLRSEKHGVMQAAFQVQVAGSLQDLLAGSNLLWDSGKVASDSSIQVPYAGSPLISSAQYLWRVRVWDEQDHSTAWSPVASWEMGLLQPGDWKARWISARSPEAEGRRPSPLMRKDFSISKPLASARVYVTSRGLYEVWINGVRVGDQLFTPGWTSYKTRFQYQTYDVTSLLQEGENALAALLGDGWYRGFIGFRGQQNYYGDQLALLLQVRLEFADGTTQFVTSDDTWKWSTGPILNSDIYMGETYDARLEIPGWGEAGFDDASWSQVDLAEYPTDNLIAPAGPPVRIMEEVRPVAILTTPAGDTVVDMGQNLVGWVRIQAEGEAGTVLTLRHAEVLDKAGNFYTENLRSAAQETVYTLKGSGVESFQPHFSFQGFRYVAVDGYPGELTIDKLTGVAIYSDMEPTGTLKTSNPLINQLQHNIVWGQKGNFLDVPTDCPQRDERLGWTGDAQVFARTAAFNMDVASFFTKWLGDLAADQREDGAIPFVVPDVLNGFASAAWADAGVIIPWTLYLTYGDQRILERQYDSMKAWVHYMKTRAGEDLIWDEGFHFGDWLAFATTRSDYPGATTDKDLIATAFYAYSTSLLSKAAKVIGRAEEAREYATLAQGIRQAFVEEFVTPKARLSSHTQTAYTLALNFDLLPEEMRETAAARLARDVRSFGNHLTTGFVGTPYLCHVLSRFGHLDVAYDLLNQETYPSWLYPVKQGATTIWERWDGIKADGTFQDPAMNSFNHYAYGAIGDWIYRVAAGIEIDPEQPGYKHVLIQPQPGVGFTQVSATLESPYGQIESSWTILNGEFTLEVTVPPNAWGTVHLPSVGDTEGLELTQSISQMTGVKKVDRESKSLSIDLGSGQYRFSYPLEP